MDMFPLDKGSQLNGDGEVISGVPEEAGVRFVVFERHVLDTAAPSDCFCHCRESCADTDHGELAVPPESITLARERFSYTLDRGVKIRCVEVLEPVAGKVLFVWPELERGCRRKTVTAHGSRSAVPREVIVVR